MAIDFGKDVSCTTGMRTGRYVTGVRLVGEAAYRRLITTRGTLRGGEAEANYGFNLSTYVGSVKSASDRAAMPGLIRSELLKDERIEAVEVVIVETTAGAELSFDIQVICTTALGPFTLKLAVTEVSTELLGII